MGDAKPDEEAAVASAPVAPAGAHERLRAVIGPACLAASILLFSANNSVLAWLLDKGPPYFTSCNILCASNLVALGGFPLLFRQDLTRRRVGSVTRKQWVGMLLSSVLANVIGALLNVEGLAKTRSVALVAIMGRLESVWFLGLALVFLGACVVCVVCQRGILTARGCLRMRQGSRIERMTVMEIGLWIPTRRPSVPRFSPSPPQAPVSTPGSRATRCYCSWASCWRWWNPPSRAAR